MVPRRQHSVCPKNDGARDRRCCLRERKEKTEEPAPLKTPSPPRLHLAPGRTFTTTRGTGPSATGKSPPGTSLRLPALNGLHLLSLAWPQRPACRQLRLCAAEWYVAMGWERIGAGGKQHGNNGAVLASAWGMGRGRHLPAPSPALPTNYTNSTVHNSHGAISGG